MSCDQIGKMLMALVLITDDRILNHVLLILNQSLKEMSITVGET